MKGTHSIEINLTPAPSPNWSVKLDGQKIKGIVDIKIEAGLTIVIPIVTLKLLAPDIKGHINGKIVKIKVKHD